MRANKEGATNYDYFFVVDKFDESQLKPNEEEVLQVFWVELEELKNNKTITSPNGKVLKTSPMVPLIAAHLLKIWILILLKFLIVVNGRKIFLIVMIIYI